jgi:LysR family cys regulon transcriptional activator
VTRQLQDLEKELGVHLFVRKRNRILSITPQGKEILAIARRMLNDAENMHRVAEEAANIAEGDLTIATTHTQARYTLPAVIHRFLAGYPKVRLRLRQGTPAQCCELVAGGKADLAVATEIDERIEGLIQVPCYRLNRSVVTRSRHPLLRARPLTLEAIAAYPVITFDEGFTGQGIITRAFAQRGLQPNVVLSAIDADVSKAYVEMGLGIAILATIAFDPKRDVNLRGIDARHLFQPMRLNVVARQHSYLRGYMREFIRMFAPKLRDGDIDDAFGGTAPAHAWNALPEL